MGETCRTYGEDETCMQSFNLKIWWAEISWQWKTYGRIILN